MIDNLSQHAPQGYPRPDPEGRGVKAVDVKMKKQADFWQPQRGTATMTQ